MNVNSIYKKGKTMKILYLLSLCLILTNASVSWKPMIEQHRMIGNVPVIAAAAKRFTSSYRLQQTHPDYGSESSSEFSMSNDGHSEEDNLYSKELLSPIPEQLLNVKNLYQSKNLPSAINFNDIRFGYKSTNYKTIDHCALKKFAFNYDGIVEYDHLLPELKQFTICFWSRFTNHSGDHVILTYATHDEPRAYQFWVANWKNSSYLSMAIKGQQIYRLNYPLRLRQWHHTCTSWNGKTGEWQLWLKAERIGRGFHNSLVDQKISTDGKLYSGGTSYTGKTTDGLHFEITLVQVYRVALSPGKAQRNHKHHHVHRVDHDGQEISTTTTRPTVMPMQPQMMLHGLLANGQIPTRVRLNIARPVQALSVVNDPLQINGSSYGASNGDVMIHTNFINGQMNTGSRLVSQQLIGLNHDLLSASQSTPTSTIHNGGILNSIPPSKIQFVDHAETHIVFKRDTQKNIKSHSILQKQLQKRDLVYVGDSESIEDDPLLIGSIEFKFDGLAEFGGPNFKALLNGRTHNIDDDVLEDEHEAAEEEVRAVMNLCSTCQLEPFQGAIVFAWRDIHEHMDNALKGYSVGGCGEF